jgi:hypothetical protein
VKILRGAWIEELFRILEGFPDLAHDDEVDASGGSLEMLNRQMKKLGPLRTLSETSRAAACRKGRTGSKTQKQPLDRKSPIQVSCEPDFFDQTPHAAMAKAKVHTRSSRAGLGG